MSPISRIHPTLSHTVEPETGTALGYKHAPSSCGMLPQANPEPAPSHSLQRLFLAH